MNKLRSARNRSSARKKYGNKFFDYEVRAITDLKGWVGLRDGNSYYGLRDLLASANKEILVVSYQVRVENPFKVNLVNELIGILVSKVQKKIDVRILINQKFPNAYLKILSDKAVITLKKEGLNVRKYKSNKTLHAKLIIVDREKLYIGSHNLTNTALSSNSEAGLIVDSKEMALQFGEYFEKMWGEVK